jgi:predicted PurR-regulated permease PerM
MDTVTVNKSFKSNSFKSNVYWLLSLLLLVTLLYMAREGLVVVFTAFIFASAVMPLVEKLDVRLPRWLAVLIPYTLLLLVGVGLVLPIAVIGFQQFQVFLSDLPVYFDRISNWLEHWAQTNHRYAFLAHFRPEMLLQQFSLQNATFFSGFTGVTLAISQTVSQVGLDLLSALVISVFMALDRDRIQQYCLRFRPPEEHARLNALIDHLISSTGGFVTGQLLFMVSFGSLIALGLYGLGLPFAILLGVLAGVLTIIPIVGANIALIPTLVIALLTPDGWVMALWVFLLFVVVQVIENNVIGPLIMGRAVGLHPLAILLSILLGGLMFGMVGIILAIPVAACFNIILEELILNPAIATPKKG